MNTGLFVLWLVLSSTNSTPSVSQQAAAFQGYGTCLDAKERMDYLKTKQVVFAIMKYGKEGLDDEHLDTVLVSLPFSSKNGLQQVLGRPARQKAGKRSPLVVFYEDDVGPLIGMCKKLRRHLLSWPLEENGPFEFEMHDHPRSIGRSFRPIFDNL